MTSRRGEQTVSSFQFVPLGISVSVGFHGQRRGREAKGDGLLMREPRKGRDVRFGSLADISALIRDVRFAPEERTCSASTSMSAKRQIADITAARNSVCLVPTATS